MDILPTVVQEAVTQCKKNGVVVPPSLATFYIRTQLLVSGKKDVVGNVEVKPDLVERLVSSANKTLTKKNSVLVETLKFQCQILEMQQEQVNAFRTDRIQHKAKSHRFAEDICEKKTPNDAFAALALFILHESNLLPRTQQLNASKKSASSTLNSTALVRTMDLAVRDANVEVNPELSQSETIAALESVFPKLHMDSFVGQRDAEKMRQVAEIWRIVWGIRLFNKATGKGGADIPDVMEMMGPEVDASVEEVLDLRGEMQMLAADYSAVLRSPSIQLSADARTRLQDEHRHVLQVVVYLRSLLDTLDALSSKVDDYREKWRRCIQDAASLVDGSGTSPVPKSAVYPKFIFISERWDTVLGLYRELKDARALLDTISQFATSEAVRPTLLKSDVDNAHRALAAEKKPNLAALATEIQRLPGASAASGEDQSIEYLPMLPTHPETGNPIDAHFEFNGFCIVSFVDEGILVQGKKAEVQVNAQETDEEVTEAARQADLCPGYIHLLANAAYYCFANERCVLAFAKDPFRYVSHHLMQLVQETPAAVTLLGLHPYLPKEIYLAGTRSHEVIDTVEKGDGGTQTGQIDAYKDTHYVFSEWELRRLALQLASLRSKRTKSTQTNQSHFRRDNDTQAFPPKEQTTQTLMDAAVQPPVVRQYIKGLRGTETSQLEQVQKTFLY